MKRNHKHAQQSNSDAIPAHSRLRPFFRFETPPKLLTVRFKDLVDATLVGPVLAFPTTAGCKGPLLGGLFPEALLLSEGTPELVTIGEGLVEIFVLFLLLFDGESCNGSACSGARCVLGETEVFIDLTGATVLVGGMISRGIAVEFKVGGGEQLVSAGCGVDEDESLCKVCAEGFDDAEGISNSGGRTLGLACT